MDKDLEKLWNKVYEEKRPERESIKKMSEKSKKLGGIIKGLKFGSKIVRSDKFRVLWDSIQNQES